MRAEDLVVHDVGGTERAIAWATSGRPMFKIRRSHDGADANVIREWAASNCKSEVIVTPSFVFFEDVHERTYALLIHSI